MEELNSLTKPTLTDVDIQNRLSLLLEFLQCNEVLYLWQYDTEGNCLWTNSSLPIYDTMSAMPKTSMKSSLWSGA